MSDLFNNGKWIRILITAAIFFAFGIMFLPFWRPLLLASLFAFALIRWVDRIGHGKKRRLFPTLMILTGFCLFITLPTLFVVLRLARSFSGLKPENLPQLSLYQSIERIMQKWQTAFNKVVEHSHINAEDIPQPTAVFAKAATWMVDQTTTLVANLPELALNLFVFAVALYFFLTEARMIRAFLINTRILDRGELDELVEIIQRSSYRTLIVSALIGALQASVVAIGSLIFGYNEFLLIFILTFCVSFIPVIGAAPVAILLSLLSLAGGEVGAAIGLAVVAVIAGSVDNLVKPYLVSWSDTPVHPLVSLLAIIGAVIMYGLPGLLLGPILTELAMRVIPIFFRRPTSE